MSFAVVPAENGKIVFAVDRDGNYEIYVDEPGRHRARRTSPTTPAMPTLACVVAGRHEDRVRHDSRRELRDLRDGRRRVEPDEPHEQPAQDSDPAWSPDGTKIAFDTDRDGNYEIYVMSADGFEPGDG